MAEYKVQEIIMIDDDSIVRMVGKRILKNLDFLSPVTQFENGLQGIEYIKEKISKKELTAGQPILILLDINMPIMDGWGFLDAFKELEVEDKNHFAISIITSSIDSSDRAKAFSYEEVLDYIQKPLAAKDLLDFLKKHDLMED